MLGSPDNPNNNQGGMQRSDEMPELPKAIQNLQEPGETYDVTMPQAGPRIINPDGAIGSEGQQLTGDEHQVDSPRPRRSWRDRIQRFGDAHQCNLL